MDVLFEQQRTANNRYIGIVILNAPSRLNAKNLEMVNTILDQLAIWQNDPAAAAVILRSSHSKAFCAGGDVRSVAHACFNEPNQAPQLARDFFSQEYRLVHTLKNYPLPVFVWGEGIIMGGGMGLFMASHYRIITPSTCLAMPEISIGLYPDAGASWFLTRMPQRLGLFMGLTGNALNAQDALDADIADVCWQGEQWPTFLSWLTESIGSGTFSDEQWQQCLADIPAADQSLLPAAQWKPVAGQIYQWLKKPNTLSQAVAFISAQSDSDSPWLVQAAKNIKYGNPLSLHLAWQQHIRSLQMQHSDNLRMEYWMSMNCCAGPDFAEGVRARLIDKDHQPKWRWKSVEEIPAQAVENMFLANHPGPHPLQDLS